MDTKNLKVVCLGGGTGTVNLVRGLKDYLSQICIVVSMADDGGSAGRLRKLYNILPPGDMVSCMAALSKEKNKLLSQLLTYRFPGDRYGKNDNLEGHKLGNLIVVALRDVTGNFEDAIAQFQKIFNIPGEFLPATKDAVTISAKTSDGKIIDGEENIDLGKYSGKKMIDTVFLHPSHAKASEKVIERINNADIIIAGPGDLYTTLLPVLIVPEISQALLQSKAKKIFIVNVANKPYETKNYHLKDYITTISKHLGIFPFEKVLLNNNISIPIPKGYNYAYVKADNTTIVEDSEVFLMDLVDEEFPLYHDSKKLAKAILQIL